MFELLRNVDSVVENFNTNYGTCSQNFTTMLYIHEPRQCVVFFPIVWLIECHGIRFAANSADYVYSVKFIFCK